MTYVYENNSEGDVLVYKKPKNRSKNYPKPKKPRKILITTETRIQNHHNRRFIQLNFQNPTLDVKR